MPRLAAGHVLATDPGATRARERRSCIALCQGGSLKGNRSPRPSL
jgi:hypothetical protein